MTPDERFERIEHVTAGWAELAKADREANRQLWHDTQKQLAELATQVNRVTLDIDRLIVETGARDKASHERDAALDVRVNKLVSAVGELIAAQRQHPQ
jgi:hypothetical protein